ncbi:ROK family transcriptional regulator [Streptomyces sp. NA04227]|uniref:ROK family protein n=1 Tax=Streptomyces sp. NA04227 TaxID=2742136 RepID=UPI001591F416|nr:ROK family transcriptional regulator [Streptomyces sp. NA04227]QKW07535.1 ROK family transcriptional regulator [Streptomyces sp. NA04227]
MRQEPRAAGGTPVLRELTTLDVLGAVRSAPTDTVRVTDLAEATGLTRPTVRQAVGDLMARDWLVPAAPDATARNVGRPAARYTFHSRRRPVLGLDIGPHRVTASVADLRGTVLASARQRVERAEASDVLAAVDRVLDEATRSAALTPSDLVQVTAGSPGLIDPDTGTIRLAPSVEGWTAVRITDHLRASANCPVHVENDANLAALAVARSLGDPTATVLAVQWGERVGAGLIISGRLHRGASCAAGEIGFVTGETDERTLEARIGAAALAAAAGSAADADPGSPLARRLLAGDDPVAALFASAAAHEEPAYGITDEAARILARAIGPLVLALDPTTVVIGGGVSRAGEVLLDAVRRQLRPLLLTKPAFALSPLGGDAVVTGAVQLAVDQVWERELAARAPRSAGT